MTSIYCSPLRVYTCLALLAICGIFSGFSLPISMFPDSSKPTINMAIPYGSLSPEEFEKVYGSLVEDRLRALSDQEIKIASVETQYQGDRAQFRILFDWGTEQKKALKEIQILLDGMSGLFPKEIRDQTNIWTNSPNQGFLAMSFYSEKRSLDELYELLEPSLTPRLSQLPSAEQAFLWNPMKKEIQVELIPEAMAAMQVLPRDIAKAIDIATTAQNGGSLLIDTNNLRIQMPRQASQLKDLKRVTVHSQSGQALTLQDLARIDLSPSLSGAQSFRTSGSPSLILFATPPPGGNIKAMAEEIIATLHELKSSWPRDVQTKLLVDPSEFIRQAIGNVIFEVFLAASLAVIILFLFIGNLKNVATAAIEIPLSIILAFILMRLFGININLISLGGLALSAGMNVDASVVVMENIFRHFESKPGPLNYKERLEIIGRAVAEVRLPIVASTMASIVVFLPLTFTSALSYAILGDLAKAVVFSHGFSAIVALILVPTIRLQLMKKAHKEQFRSPIEASIVRLEKLYIWTLSLFLKSRKFQLFSYFALVGSLVFLVGFILPLLPKEIIGLPDTDWIVLGLNTQGHSRLGQMEDLTAKDEIRIMQKFGESVSYTFTQVQGPNRSTVMARLKDKSEMKKVLDEFKQIFQNSPQVHYFIIPWNPSELPIPDPPHFQASIQGGTAWERLETAHRMHSVLESSQLFDRVWQNPSYEDGKSILIRPHLDQWAPLAKAGVALLPYDLTDISRVASQGRFIGQMVLNNRSYRINLSYPQGRIKTVEDLKSFPLGVKSKIIPLGALAQIDIEKGEAPRFRKDHLDTVLLSAKLDQTSSPDIKAIGESAMNLLNDWLSNNKMTLEKMNVQFEDAQFELNDALKQLSWAIGLSILLVFVTMIIQLGSIVSSLLVLVSIPLGLIGVISSLYLFNSTLSLNSALGIILLNGIAVSNSIILVDFINKLIKSGKEVHSATLEAARTRLRPILMTSLTTSIGMLPIAFGLGEGGSVLQPLGIAVSGGLWISMCLTLYTVPALQFAYWNWRQSQGSTYLPSDILLSTKLKG